MRAITDGLSRKVDYSNKLALFPLANSLLAVVLFLLSSSAMAVSSGITGRSMASSTCNACHISGAVSSNISLLGADSAEPGAQLAISVVIPTGNFAGFNLSASSGNLSAGTLSRKLGSELTHSAATASSGGAVQWDVSWTAPGNEGDQTLFVCGQPVNRNGTTSGDGPTSCTTKTITVQAAAENQAPVADDNSITVEEASMNTSLGLSAPTDADGDELTITVTGLPTLGSVTLADGSAVSNGQGLTVTELTGLQFDAPNDVQSDSSAGSFSYSVDDGNGGIVSGQVSIQVLTVNMPPSITTINDQVVSQDESLGPLVINVDDAESASSELVLSASSSNVDLVPDENIALGGDGSERIVTITPLAGQSGTTTITLTVSDGTDSAESNFDLTVEPASQGLTVTAPADTMIEVNTSTGALSVTVGDPDGGVDDLVVSGSSGNTSLVPDTNIVFGGSGSQRTVTVTPVADQSGMATITIRVSDGEDSAEAMFTVTVQDSLLIGNTDDTGPGSLREAIAAAGDGEVVRFSAADFPADTDPGNNPVITLESPLLIEQALTIDGDVNDDGVPDVTLSASAGALQINTAANVAVQGLMITGGSTQGGGAIVVDGGAVVDISATTISGNSAQMGGAVANLFGTVMLSNSDLSGNSAENGGAIANMGSESRVMLDSNTLAENQASASGGAIYNAGGTVELANTTVSGNDASTAGGGLFNTEGGTVALNNVTLTGNSAAAGGGLGMDDGSVVITNSIAAGNMTSAQSGAIGAAAAGDGDDIRVDGGSLTLGFSLVQDIAGDFGDDGTNVLAADAQLGPLFDNGGKTRTHALVSTSPAIEAGDSNAPGDGGSCESFDQTGRPRPIDGDGDGGAICDMGAFEFDVLSAMDESTEDVLLIQEQYIAFYGRPGDPGGVRFWVGQLQQAGNLGAIQNNFGNSREFAELIVPGDATSVEELTREQKGDLINGLFNNMFGRDVEGTVEEPESGLGFWTGQLESPDASLINISTRVADGAQNQDRRVLDARVALAQRITEEFVIQNKAFTEALINDIRAFLFSAIDDENDDPQSVDVASFVAQLE